MSDLCLLDLKQLFKLSPFTLGAQWSQGWGVGGVGALTR